MVVIVEDGVQDTGKAFNLHVHMCMMCTVCNFYTVHVYIHIHDNVLLYMCILSDMCMCT